MSKWQPYCNSVANWRLFYPVYSYLLSGFCSGLLNDIDGVVGFVLICPGFMLLSFLTNQPSDGFCKCYGNIQYLSAQKALKA